MSDNLNSSWHAPSIKRFKKEFYKFFDLASWAEIKESCTKGDPQDAGKLAFQRFKEIYNMPVKYEPIWLALFQNSFVGFSKKIDNDKLKYYDRDFKRLVKKEIIVLVSGINAATNPKKA